jgi:hypothetical protein
LRWPTLAFQPDLLTARNPGWDLDLDVLAGRQMHTRLGAFGRIGKRDCQRSMQILPRAGCCVKILFFEVSAETASTAGAASAEHAA